MALESNIPSAQPNELRRAAHTFLNGDSVTASAAMNGFVTENKTGCVIMVKATSTAGTPKFTLSLQTSFEDVNATYVDVSAICRPDFAEINDELWHIWTLNFSNCMQYARFYITLGVGDGGDDKFYFHTCFLYGSFTHASDVTLEAGSVSLGDVRIRDASAAAQFVDVNDASTGRAVTTHVLAVQHIDQTGKVLQAPALGAALMVGAIPMTLATDDTHFGAVGAAASVTGVIHAQLRSVGEALEKIDDWEDAAAFADYMKATIYGENGAGAPVKMLMDAAGNPQVDVVTIPAVTLSAVAAFSADNSAAIEASSVSKGSAGRLYKVSGRIDATAASATYYFQLLDSAVLPADGAVTHIVAPIKIIHSTGTDTFFDLDFTGNDINSGVAGANGIVWCVSSTEFNKLITGAVASATVLYV